MDRMKEQLSEPLREQSTSLNLYFNHPWGCAMARYPSVTFLRHRRVQVKYLELKTKKKLNAFAIDNVGKQFPFFSINQFSLVKCKNHVPNRFSIVHHLFLVFLFQIIIILIVVTQARNKPK